jgi:hypothetical protein
MIFFCHLWEILKTEISVTACWSLKERINISLSCDIKRVNSILKFEVFWDVTLWPWASSTDNSKDPSGFIFRIEESEENDIVSRTIVRPKSETVDSSRLLGFYITYKSRARLCIRNLGCRNINFARFASPWCNEVTTDSRKEARGLGSDFLWSRIQNIVEPHNPWIRETSQG